MWFAKWRQTRSVSLPPSPSHPDLQSVGHSSWKLSRLTEVAPAFSFLLLCLLHSLPHPQQTDVRSSAKGQLDREAPTRTQLYTNKCRRSLWQLQTTEYAAIMENPRNHWWQNIMMQAPIKKMLDVFTTHMARTRLGDGALPKSETLSGMRLDRICSKAYCNS